MPGVGQTVDTHEVPGILLVEGGLSSPLPPSRFLVLRLVCRSLYGIVGSSFYCFVSLLPGRFVVVHRFVTRVGFSVFLFVALFLCRFYVCRLVARLVCPPVGFSVCRLGPVSPSRFCVFHFCHLDVFLISIASDNRSFFFRRSLDVSAAYSSNR